LKHVEVNDVSAEGLCNPVLYVLIKLVHEVGTSNCE
jgi:hypothetical protein